MNRILATRTSLLLLAGWLAVVALGCVGGSGSSGFDLAPSLEDAHIADVLASRECREINGVAFCPTDESPLPLPPATFPNPAEGDVRLDTGLAGIDSLSCAAPPCQLQLSLTAAGLPPDAVVQVALRDPAVLGMWRIEDAVHIAADRALTAAVDVQPGGTAIQAAVLVYVGVEPLAAGEIAVLSDSGAALIFVSAPIPLVP